MSNNTLSVGEYLIEKLYDLGIRHVFGVPGDFVIGFYAQVARSNKIKIINMCDEQGAGFAADAYARMSGLGALCITYCVGGLKVVNPIAGGYAEKSPIVVISGSPGITERKKGPLIHHMVKDFDTQQRIFENVTVASTVLYNPETAPQEIDRVLNSALKNKRPVYIEIPRDVTYSSVQLGVGERRGVRGAYNAEDSGRDNTSLSSKGIYKDNLAPEITEALNEVAAMINSSKKPVILAGVELHRYLIQDKLLYIAEKFQIPVACTLSSKSVISELHTMYLGLYEGAMGHEYVREYIESSDCLILLGAFVTDLDIGGGLSSKIDQGRTISITSEKISVRYHSYEDMDFMEFINKISASKDITPKKRVAVSFRHLSKQEFSPEKDKKITVARLFECLNAFLDDDMIVVADTGDALFGSTDLTIHKRTEFISSAFYASMGFAMPASIGAQLANPRLRPVVLVGDGAFQMTGMEISTSFRYNLNPIVLVLNNQGYGTERSILDGVFNDIPIWKYNIIPQMLGGGNGYSIETEAELADALLDAEKNTKSFSILDIHLDPYDKSPALQRLTESLRKKAI
jgi:indolepyruvate decarboxylase